MKLVDKASDLFVKGSLRDDDYEDPTFFGFDINFEFSNPIDKSTGLAISPLFGDPTVPSENAESYLSNIGAVGPAANLRKFKENIYKIQNTAPYYFQSIDGLKALWGPADDKWDSFYAKDIILTVGCLESLDLLMTSTLDAYRKASMDTTHMRRLLPENLRNFSVTVTITEMRKFNTIMNLLAPDEFDPLAGNTTLLQKLQTNPNINTLQNYANGKLDQGKSLLNSKIADAKSGFKNKSDIQDLRSVDGYASFMVFRLEMCELLVNESFPMDMVDVGSGSFDQVKQSFKIKVGKVKEVNYYNLLGYLSSSFKDDNFGSSFEQDATDSRFVRNFIKSDETITQTNGELTNLYTGKPVVTKTKLGQAADQLENKIINEITSITGNTSTARSLEQLYLGNVYHPNGIQKFLDRNQYLVNLGKLALS